MSPSRRRSQPPPEQQPLEWVGGRLRSPLYITDDDPPYRPELVLWVELPSELIVAGEILDPDPAPLSLARTLLGAFRNPQVGPPRRPRRIRVADEVDAAEVRAAVGRAIEVVVAPTPELHAVLDAMAENLAGEAEVVGGDEDASYLEDGRVSADVVAGLFAAGRVLYAAAPWKQCADEQTLRMDAPALGVEGACVSIIGALGQLRGLLIFPSQTACDAFHLAGAGLLGEGPVDLGTTVLSLTFERADELPPPMRREALRHGWPVAAPEAYPRVQHRDRDGVPRPLTERDVRIATACAFAVVSFAMGHGRAFLSGASEPVSVTCTGDDEVDVRLTAPYDAWDLFDPDPRAAYAESDAAERGPPARPSRNAPCWCGSGKKYKRCHLARDRAADETRSTAPAPIHTADERLVHRMARFASARFGERWLEDARRPFADAEAAVQLFLPWAVYHVPVDGRPVVDWFLAEEGRRLSREERSWLEAQRTAWLGLWEVLEVTPGSGLEVRDLLTGVERRVTEVSGSRTLVARDAVLGRVVDHGGISVFAGLHPRPLAPADAAELVRRVRGRVRLRRAIPAERLRDPAVERYCIKRWEEAVATMDMCHSLPPVLHNTDGEELVFTTDHFAFDPAARREVRAALAAVEELGEPEFDEGGDVYTFVRAERAREMLPGATVVGRVRLEAAGLALETNSMERADRLRARLEAACGRLLTHRAREHSSPSALGEPAMEEVEEPPPSPEALRAVSEWLERYEATWVDHAVPALDGMTPREAARTREGRERLDVLLKGMENDAARRRGGGVMDVARLRTELGMED